MATRSARLRWLGHSCFHLTSPDGVEVLIDPFDLKVGYPAPELPPVDLVLITHEHSDHSNAALAPGTPKVVRGLTPTGWRPGTEGVRDVHVTMVGGAYHDEMQGTQRGRTALIVIRVAGVRLLHLGDLGHALSAELIATLRDPDVLCVPVGGHYTIDGPAARRVAESLQPRITIPMHYKTPRLPPDHPIASLEDSGFLTGATVQMRDAAELALEPERVPSGSTVVVFRTP